MDEDDRCDQCGSTDLFVEEDGRTYCENGHDQGRAPVTGDDDLDFARHGKVIRKKEPKEKQKVSGVLHGPKAYQLFLQSWQLILRKQCYALVHEKGLPAELWTIVRDLWVLWLSRLDHRLQEPSDSHPFTEPASEADPATTSANETDTEPEKEQQRKSPDSSRNGPALLDTVALNYLGVLLLRRPISLATMLEWIQREDIPFIRAIRHVPAEMKDRLPGEYHLRLETVRMIEEDDLQAAVYRCTKMYSMSFGMIMPPLNHNLFLLSYVRSLALPIEVYSIAQRLNGITKYLFCYPDATTLGTSRRQPTTYPEAQLMSLIVVATKLLFPFDSHTVKRYPKDANDPTTMRMDWAAWLDAKRNWDKRSASTTQDTTGGGLRPGSEIHVKDSDILSMTEHQLDQYMDWYQRTWIDDNNSQKRHSQSQGNTIDKEILDMFPLHDLPDLAKTREEHERQSREDESQLTIRIKEVQSSLMSRRAISAEEEAERGIQVLRPGAMFLRIWNLEDLAATETVVKAYHQEAARAACLSVKALLRAVNHCEERIDEWLKARRRQEVFRDEDADEGHDDSDIQEQETDKSRQFETRHEDNDAVATAILATSPPNASASGTMLARDLSGLDIQSSPRPYNQSDSDEDMDLGM